jgi:hypothetical protein
MSREQVAALVASPYGPPPATPMPVPLVAHPPPPAVPVPTLAPEEASGIKEKLEPRARSDRAGLNRLVVSAYKAVGFVILGTILLGLASFIFTNLFYMVNASWMTPLELSSTDPRVLQLDAQRAAAKAARDALAQQRLELVARTQDAKRVVASEETFQRSFGDAMKASLADQSAQLAGFQRLVSDLEKTRREVTATNKEYAALSADELKKQYDAHLIDVDQRTKGGYELAQIAGANLALHQRNVEVDARITELRRAVRSLKGAGSSGTMSYDVLHMRHEYDQSVLASQKAADEASALEKSVAMLDKTIADYDGQLTRIEKAPYLLAADASVSTAFVPYDNVEAVKLGDDVYACAVSVIACKKIGRVAELLEGEVVGKHPLHNREMRGVLVRLQLDDADAVQKPVLHLHRAPLGL